MINKTQEEIMKNWVGDINNPLVSIKCTAYNHESYISDALDGFLTQETTFPFEVIVHDDASTDNTANIIREYEEKYPLIIKPIYETENQYSKHDGSISKIIDSRIKGKYVAFCEGDDYWVGSSKLLKQYNYMKSHDECSLCVHNTKIIDINNNLLDETFNQHNEERNLDALTVFDSWTIHTSSYFIKNDIYHLIQNNNRSDYWFGDYVLICWSLYYGEIHYFPDIMSIYRKNIPTGITYMNNVNNNILAKKELIRAAFLKDYNYKTNGKFYTTVKKRIEVIEKRCLLLISDKELFKNNITTFYKINIISKIRVILRIYFPFLYRKLKIIKDGKQRKCN